jgi:hypothetical protein
VDETTLEHIKLAHHPCGGKAAEMVKYLKKYYGIRLSRDRLAAILDLLGLPRVKRRRS